MQVLKVLKIIRHQIQLATETKEKEIGTALLDLKVVE